MKIYPIKDCLDCPCMRKGGPYGNVLFLPFCNQGKYLELPYTKIQIGTSEKFRAAPTYEIHPECTLEDYDER